MAIQLRETLRGWFRRGKYPTEEQFSDWMDSYWHKTEDKVGLTDVEGLADRLNGKYDRASGEEQERLLGELREEFDGYSAGADSDMDALSLRIDAEAAARADGDAATLDAAKMYSQGQTDAMRSDTYRKDETYSRAETDGKDADTLAAARAEVTARIAELVDGSPGALDTLYEIAAALGNDPNFATTVMALINGKADGAHTHTYESLTGKPSIPTVGDGVVTVRQNGAVRGTVSMNQATPTEISLDDTWRPVADNLTTRDAEKSLSAAQGAALKDLADGKADAAHTHTRSQITDFAHNHADRIFVVTAEPDAADYEEGDIIICNY